MKLHARRDPWQLAARFGGGLGLHRPDNWPMAEVVTGHRMQVGIACNCNVFWENYREGPLCPGIHPELRDMGPIYPGGIMGESARRSGGLMRARWQSLPRS